MADKTTKQKMLELKARMNRAIGTYAHLTHIIPKGPRQKVRDWMIRKTSPVKLAVPEAYRPGKYRDGINEYGFFKEETGLGQGARCYAKAIETAGIPHRFIHLNFLEWLPGDDRSYEKKLKRKPTYAGNVMHLNPDLLEEALQIFPKRFFDRHYNIGVWLWELETLPDCWLKSLDFYDEIWTPSEFIAKAVRKETDKPVTVIPYGIEPKRADMNRRDLGLPEDKFITLAMFDAHSYTVRKNPMAAIEAFTEAFAGNPEALLVLKANHPKDDEIARLEEQLKEAGIQYRLIRDRMPREQLNDLMACCDVFISLHRSEGFGLPIAEAMALGTAVVATNWSANAEFMDETCAGCIGYRMVPVGDQYAYETKESDRWADPDIHEAARYLKKLYEDPEYRKQVSQAGKEHIRKTLSVEKCGERMKKRLEEILLR